MTLSQVLILAAEETPKAPPLWMQIIPMVVIFLFFYMLVLRPSPEKKKREELMGELKKNDKVVTIGGIIGTIADVGEDRVTLKVDDNTRIKLRKSGIHSRYEENSKADSK